MLLSYFWSISNRYFAKFWNINMIKSLCFDFICFYFRQKSRRKLLFHSSVVKCSYYFLDAKPRLISQVIPLPSLGISFANLFSQSVYYLSVRQCNPILSDQPGFPSINFHLFLLFYLFETGTHFVDMPFWCMRIKRYK